MALYRQLSRQNGWLLKLLDFSGMPRKTVLSGSIVKRGTQETIRLDPCIPPIPRCNSTAITARLSRMFGPDDAHPSQPSLAPPVSGFFALIAFQPHVLRFLSKLMTARPSTVSPSTIPAAERTSGGMKIPSGVKPSPFLTSTSALNDFSTPEAGDRDVGETDNDRVRGPFRS